MYDRKCNQARWKVRQMTARMIVHDSDGENNLFYVGGVRAPRNHTLHMHVDINLHVMKAALAKLI